VIGVGRFIRLWVSHRVLTLVGLLVVYPALLLESALMSTVHSLVERLAAIKSITVHVVELGRYSARLTV